MTFDRENVADFAAWSRDRNPLHVDPEFARQTHFGQQVVHGVLTVLGALEALPRGESRRLTTIDIEFRQAVFIGSAYEPRVSAAGPELAIGLYAGPQHVLQIRAGFDAVPPPADADRSWIGAAEQPVRDTPAVRAIDDLQPGLAVAGSYRIEPRTSPASGSGLSETGAQVLALCSYLTGMELPGLKSLFTRITLSFHADAPPGADLRYRGRVLRFDRQFRLLDTELMVATADGEIVATGLLRAYVPFSPAQADLSELADRLSDASSRLSGKVALVVGGSRGVGADISAALALAGAHVYVSARRDDETRRARHAELAARGAPAEFIEGDAGDPSWCQAALEQIRARHGRLDLLVLNACAPPTVQRVEPESAARREAYVRENLRLVETPLTTLAPALAEHHGAVVFMSSSFVQDTPPGFAHYVALKQAGESLLRTIVRERPDLTGLVARPPVLQTRWNDTPSGIVGSIPADWAASHIVNRLAESWTAGRVDVLAEFTPFEARRPAAAARPADLAIRIAASFTTDPLVPAVQFWMKELDLDAAVDTAPYGQQLQSLLNPESVLNARGRGANVLLLRVQDWLRELPDEHVADIERVREYLQRTTRDFESAVRAHRAQASNETLLLICPSYGLSSSAERILVRQTEETIAASLAGVAGVQVVSAALYHAAYDVNEDEVHDALRDHIAHIPYVDDYLHVLAALVARHVYRRIAPVRKVAVVDCDNTLWRGVVGEQGAEGVEFDAGHRALQALLVRLTQRGVLVCLCSKNEESDVWSVFDTRSDFGLRREHVVAAMVNWLPKSQNLRTLAARLNLGLDSFVFIDDNPVECAEVRAGCPEVLTIQWPQDPERAERLTRHIWEFDEGKSTKEDARRTELYKEEFRRQEARAEVTFESFIESLQLEVDFSPLTADDLRRSAQLTLRTNQFNFTTIRREEADVQALADGGRHEIRTVRVRDRFGDYGLVGLLIAERGEQAWNLDTFLLSCRVLGRGVEHRIMSDLGRMASSAGAQAVRMRVATTKRNAPARSFFEAVVPGEYRQGNPQGVEAEVPAAALAEVRFEPASSGEVIVEDDGGSKAAAPVDARQLRRREEQIARAAFELAAGAAMRAAAEGRPAPAPGTARADESDVAAIVHDAFAAALRVQVDTVVRTDGLEALGCDSLKIVEITVALSERFPWLPSTLLFEHRSVSQIVREIVRLSAPQAAQGSSEKGSRRDDRPAARAAGSRDIAVVGIGVRCAGADSPGELWSLLSAGQSSVKPVPEERPYFLHPLSDTRPHWAGLLDRVGAFDPEFFGVSPREAEVMDPQLRLFLEVAWAALEDAGLAGAAHDDNTGVFAGVMYADYGFRANANDRDGVSAYRCWEGFSLANRLSQLLGFHGPSLAVDTACSSSATAVHLACSALAAGDCQVALAGGVNLILDPDRLASLGRLGILSSRGRCEPFGADADGTVLGEGAGVVVLRPLSEALRRGDRIYGVIKGTGLSTGSGTVGFTAPNPQAQAEAIRRSLHAAAVDPRTISYVETHGTGTLLGDPIEVRGLTLAYTDRDLQQSGMVIDQRCAIGSIKPNVGHLEAGAGVVGLIKILLQLAHETRVPSITSAQPSPQIPFAQVPFAVQRELAPWPRPIAYVDGRPTELPRRAGLNSFGVGGANAHLIVEEPPGDTVRPAAAHTTERPRHVLALSAVNDAGLSRQLERAARHFERDTQASIADVCYSVNTGHKHLGSRVAVSGANRDELLGAIRQAAGGERRAPASRPTLKMAWLFTGQGSQYAGMGRELYATQPVFRAALDRCADLLDALIDRPLRDLLFAPDESADAALLNQTGYTQPALFAFEYALGSLWLSWGVRPDMVMGHSVGEIAAVCVAGGLSLEDGCRLIAARGRLMQALPPGGVMTSVMADEGRVLAAIGAAHETVAIAAVNAPEQVVISGAEAAVAEVSARLGADGIRTKALTVSHAFHSPLMKPMLADYAEVVRRIRFTTPRIPVVSCVDGVVAHDAMLQPEYWLRQVMEPVRFAAGMATLEQHDVNAYVEIGPHPVLLPMGRRCVADDARAIWLPSLNRSADTWATLLGSVGELYEAGGDIDWRGFDAPYARRRVAAPSYAFGEREYWLKDVPVLERSGARGDSARTATEGATRVESYELAWRAQAAPAATRQDAADAWVLFADRGGIAAGLARALAAAGATVTTVEAGAAFAVTGSRYQIDPRDPAHYERLWAEVSSGAAPRVAHLWSADAPANDGLDAEALEDAALRGLVSVTHLTRALSKAGVSRPSLWVITRHAVAVDGKSGVSLPQAPVWGLGRTVSLEHPDLWGGLIDVGGDDAGGTSEALVRELRAGSPEDQVALRPGSRFVPRLVRVPDVAVSGPSLSGDGVYVVTGGLGALGLHAARWLVSQGARRIVLCSRRASDDARVSAAIADLASRGAAVTVVAGDVSVGADVDRLIAEATKDGAAVRGVVHAAGIDAVTPLASLSADAIRDVFAAKGKGAWLLHQRTRGLRLDLFVCFSSVASVLGAQGRAHYAAANALLDGLAFERRRLGLPVTVVNWGPWRGGGMATETSLRQFERIGNRGLEPAAAAQALGRAVAGGKPQTMVAAIDWDVFQPAFETARARPVLSEIAAGPAAAADRTAAPWVALLDGVPVDGREARLASLIRAEVAETMGFDDSGSVPPDREFHELGIDSLMMADLVGRLRKQVGFSCSALVFDHPNVRALAARLLQQLPLADGVRDETRVETTVRQPAPASASPQPIAGYSPDVEDEILAFQPVGFAGRDPELVAPRWRWMFVESARRLGRSPRFWIYRDHGTVAGQMGSIPVQLHVDGSTLSTGWLVETMVLEQYRQQAVGSRLMVQAHDDEPFSLSLGQSAEMREIQFRLGWQQVAPLQIAQRIVRPENVLSGKLPKPAAWAASLGLKATTLVRDWMDEPLQLTVRPVDHFGAAHDRLWTEAARDLRCAVVRDASYLNWKYVAQPGQQFMRLEILDGERLAGVAVWMFRAPDRDYRYGRAFLVDLVAPMADAPLLQQIVKAACAAVVETGVDALLCHHVGWRLTGALKAAGFHLRQPERFLLVDTEGLAPAVREVVLDAESWFVTLGDSDIDRPW